VLLIRAAALPQICVWDRWIVLLWSTSASLRFLNAGLAGVVVASLHHGESAATLVVR
jgi:hypothetical protein